MKKQYGRLTTGGAIALIFLAFILSVAGVIGLSYIGAHNTGVTYTADIKKFDKESQNVLSTYTLKVQEMAQVPAMYVKDLKTAIEATFQGRYGADGSKAMMNWIQERNLPFDSSMYKNLQMTMEAGRNEFKLSQTKKLDVCANFEKELGYFWGGTWLGIAGYHEVPEKECRIIIDSSTSNQFDTGVATMIKLGS